MIPGQVWGKDSSGKYFFNADNYPLSYANEADVTLLSGVSIVFPDFRKGNAYQWQQWDSGDASHNPRESAISLITMPGQEWGPTTMLRPPTSGCEIPDVVITTVPENADHCIYEVNLTRTVTPSQVNGNTVPVIFQEGQWVQAYGGSLLVEWSNPYTRMLQFYLAPIANGDGTRNVLMRMIQSVVNQRQYNYRQDNDYNKTGWSWGGPYGSAFGIPVSFRASGGPATDVAGVGGRYKRGGANAVATSDNTNYSSTFTGQIRVRPGRSGITPTSGGADPTQPFYFVTDIDQIVASTTTYTFSGKQFGPAPTGVQTRRMMVSLTSGGANNISSVTIGGVAATLVATVKLTTVATSAIYIANVPTGDTGNVVVTFSGNQAYCNIQLCAGYNMASSTPDAIIQNTTSGQNQSLATVASGWTMAIGVHQPFIWDNIIFANQDPQLYGFSGMGNMSTFPASTTAGATIASTANQNTDGSTLTVQLRNNGSGVVANSCAWVAASFH